MPAVTGGEPWAHSGRDGLPPAFERRVLVAEKKGGPIDRVKARFLEGLGTITLTRRVFGFRRPVVRPSGPAEPAQMATHRLDVSSR
jgi:hypothetical protein